MSSPLRTPYTIRARWVFPVEGPPLEGGAITVVDGRIQTIEEKPSRKPDLDLDAAAILPGLVNAHTHLDLTGLRGQHPPRKEFTDWLRDVVKHRRTLTPEQTLADIQSGLNECLRFGTSLVGDVSAEGLSARVFGQASIWGVVFYELLGLSKDRARAAYEEAADWLVHEQSTETCKRALSPHATYSVRAALFSQVADLTATRQFPVAIHLAETLDELQLLEGRTGPFVKFLRELDAWDPDGLVVSPGHVIDLFAGTPNALLIHCNYLNQATTIHVGQTIVYCPRTHAAFGHAPHPFREFLARGVRVALGTDSLASNPDLDLLAEARFVHRHYPDVPGDVLLRMATLSGAEALSFETTTGSLTVGKSADLIVVPIEAGVVRDPHALVWQSEKTVERVMWRGRWIPEPKAP